MKKLNSKKKKSVTFRNYKDLPYCAVSLNNTLYNKTGKWSSFRPEISKKKCTSCLLCWKFCPEACIKIVDNMPVIDYDYCKGCGICVDICGKGAIIMKEDKR